MKVCVKVFHFLGSLRLTIALLAALLLFIALSASGQFCRHPLFLALLASAFLNLLLAVFRKLPWNIKHLPFLLAHLGFMMVITGALANAFFGYSGIMVLAESLPQKVIIPGTYALSIEKKGEASPHLASVEKLPLLSVSGLQASLLKGAPNSKQKLRCSHENQIFFSSLDKKSSFQQVRLSESIRSIPVLLGNQKWQTSAIKGGYVGEHVADLSSRQAREKTPVLSFIQDENLEEYIVMIGKNGSVSVSSIESLLKHALVSFENGSKGYGVEAAIPAGIGEGSIFFKVWPSAEHLPMLAKEEENIPSIHLCFSDGENSEILSLTYDPTASSFMWPIFDGKYLVRYQPMEHVLPFRLNLEMAGGNAGKVTLGYNAPHALEGYQFTLLKNPPGEKQTRIGVQRAPAKKALIYPGIICAGLGILLLFIRKNVSVENDSSHSHATPSARPAPRRRKRAVPSK